MVGVNFKVSANVQEAVKQFAKAAGGLDEKKMLRLIGERHLRWIHDNFAAEGSERKWRRLTRGTIEARRGTGDDKILQDSGRLRQSFTILSVSKDRVETGTRDKRAPWFQFGTPARTITARAKRVLTIPSPSGPVVFTKGKLAGKRGFFAKSVRHPGTPRRPLLPTKALAEKLAVRVIDAAAEKAVRELNRDTIL